MIRVFHLEMRHSYYSDNKSLVMSNFSCEVLRAGKKTFAHAVIMLCCVTQFMNANSTFQFNTKILPLIHHSGFMTRSHVVMDRLFLWCHSRLFKLIKIWYSLVLCKSLVEHV